MRRPSGICTRSSSERHFWELMPLSNFVMLLTVSTRLLVARSKCTLPKISKKGKELDLGSEEWNEKCRLNVNCCVKRGPCLISEIQTHLNTQTLEIIITFLQQGCYLRARYSGIQTGLGHTWADFGKKKLVDDGIMSTKLCEDRIMYATLVPKKPRHSPWMIKIASSPHLFRNTAWLDRTGCTTGNREEAALASAALSVRHRV